MRLRRLLDKLNLAYRHRRRLRVTLSSYLDAFADQGAIWGSLTDADEAGVRRALQLAAEHDGPLIEVGVLFGHTTNLLASLKQPDRRLIGVECYRWNPFQLTPDEHRRFTHRTLRCALASHNTELYDGLAEDFYAAHPTLRPALVFIDAGHDYTSVSRDIAWARQVGCPVISGHDYAERHPGVRRAVDEAFGASILRVGNVWIHTTS